MHIATKHVRTKSTGADQVINASDFNPELHEEVTETQLAQEPPKKTQEKPKPIAKKRPHPQLKKSGRMRRAA